MILVRRSTCALRLSFSARKAASSDESDPDEEAVIFPIRTVWLFTLRGSERSISPSPKAEQSH